MWLQEAISILRPQFNKASYSVKCLRICLTSIDVNGISAHIEPGPYRVKSTPYFSTYQTDFWPRKLNYLFRFWCQQGCSQECVNMQSIITVYFWRQTHTFFFFFGNVNADTAVARKEMVWIISTTMYSNPHTYLLPKRKHHQNPTIILHRLCMLLFKNKVFFKKLLLLAISLSVSQAGGWPSDSPCHCSPMYLADTDSCHSLYVFLLTCWFLASLAIGNQCWHNSKGSCAKCGRGLW